MSKRQLEEDSATNKRRKLQLPMCKCGISVAALEGECFKCVAAKRFENYHKAEDEEFAIHITKLQGIAKVALSVVDNTIAVKKKERADQRAAGIERFTKNLNEQVQALLAMLEKPAVNPA